MRNIVFILFFSLLFQSAQGAKFEDVTKNGAFSVVLSNCDPETINNVRRTSKDISHLVYRQLPLSQLIGGTRDFRLMLSTCKARFTGQKNEEQFESQSQLNRPNNFNFALPLFHAFFTNQLSEYRNKLYPDPQQQIKSKTSISDLLAHNYQITPDFKIRENDKTDENPIKHYTVGIKKATAIPWSIIKDPQFPQLIKTELKRNNPEHLHTFLFHRADRSNEPMTPEQNKTVNSALIIFCKTLYQLNSERTDKKLAPVQIECIDLPLITLEEKTLKKLFLCNHFIKAIAIDCSNIHELLNFSTPKKSNRSEFICKKFRGRNWQTVLHEVAKQGRLELCRSIVNLAPELIHRLDIHGRTPCWYAAHAGLIESVKFFIEECNLPLDHCDDFGRTLLHAAALGGHYDVAEYLIIKNIDINETIKKECRKSIKNGSPDSRKLFLLFGGQDEDAPNNLPNNQNNQNIPAQRGGNGNDRATQWILTPTKICIAAIVLLFPLLLKYYGAALFQKKISRSLNTALQWIRPTHNTPNQK